MALLLLISSSGLTMDVHLCQGHFKRANLLGKAKTCSEVNACLKKCGKSTSTCASKKACSMDGDHKGCCDNKSFQLDMDTDTGDVVTSTLTDTQVKFISAFINVFILDIKPTSHLHNHYNYYPPPLDKDISILFQTFLL